jgi:hypothetical protein
VTLPDPAEGTSFIQMLDDTRRELAEQYLERMHLSLPQAAYLLGFADMLDIDGITVRCRTSAGTPIVGSTCRTSMP